MIKLFKYTRLAFCIYLMQTNSFSGTRSYAGWIYVNKISHYSSEIRVGFSNYTFGQSDECSPTTNPAITNSVNDWKIVLRTSDPYYKEFLSVLMVSKIKNIPIDVEWSCSESYLMTGYNMRVLTAVGLTKTE